MIAEPKWITTRTTPNTSPRTKPIRFIILHHGGGSAEGDLAWLTNPASGVSADFYVDREGRVYKLNPQVGLNYTWHAGESAWGGYTAINRHSVGIEQEHRPGQDWPDAQVAATAHLCAWLAERYKLPIDSHPFQSHAAVAMPRGRKTDPEGFPWAAFSKLVRTTLAD